MIWNIPVNSSPKYTTVQVSNTFIQDWSARTWPSTRFWSRVLLTEVCGSVPCTNVGTNRFNMLKDDEQLGGFGEQPTYFECTKMTFQWCKFTENEYRMRFLNIRRNGAEGGAELRREAAMFNHSCTVCTVPGTGIKQKTSATYTCTEVYMLRHWMKKEPFNAFLIIKKATVKYNCNN